MAKPLTKISKKTGNLYTRPPNVEHNIDGALAQDPETISKRLLVTDRGCAEHLTSECLVHLFREAFRRGDKAMRDRLATVLLQRCEAIVKHKLPDSGLANAAYLRDEVLGIFAELLASDGCGENPDELDYFECKFNGAFRSLRIDLLRSEGKQRKRFKQFPRPSSASKEDEDDEGTDQGPCCRAKQGDGLAREEVLNALPPEVRRAVLLSDMGYDVESEDPEKRTIATICGVTGRTIRNRLKQARDILQRLNREEI
jgi:hypothetical protein